MTTNRDKLIQMIDGVLANDSEWFQTYKFDLTEIQHFISSDEYLLLKQKGYYDEILKHFITLLGLRFAIFHDNLTDWYDKSDNKVIIQLDRWEELINGTSN